MPLILQSFLPGKQNTRKESSCEEGISLLGPSLVSSFCQVAQDWTQDTDFRGAGKLSKRSLFYLTTDHNRNTETPGTGIIRQSQEEEHRKTRQVHNKTGALSNDTKKRHEDKTQGT